MYSGRIVERGTASEVFHNPCHPYTIGLMKSKPVVGKKVKDLYNIPGNVPNPVNMPDYCYFRDRCEFCDNEKCSGKYPPEIKISDTHVVSCYRFIDKGEVVGYPQIIDPEDL
jgi:peptide/nickel transport system ATP-binding protein